MFPVVASPQTFPGELVARPPVQKRPADLFFGKTAQAQDRNEAQRAPSPSRLDTVSLTRMQEALKKAMPKYHYTIDENFVANSVTKLTFDRAKAQVNHLSRTVSGEDLSRFNEAGKLGLVEESSDMFFEMYTLKAIYGGLITKAQVKQWAAALPKAIQGEKQATGQIPNILLGGKAPTALEREKLLDGSMFLEQLQAIRQDIETRVERQKSGPIGSLRGWAFNHFRKEVNRGWVDVDKGQQAQQDRALDLLALIGMKFALMTRKDPNYRIFGNNIKLLWDEAEEFREEMHGDSASDTPTKWLIASMAGLYSLPFMPYRPFQWLITRQAGQELNYVDKHHAKGQSEKLPRFNIDYKDLMETVFSKQIGRQELDFSRPDIDARLEMRPDIRLNQDAMKNGNAKRKCILKPYELWQESAVLKNATLGENKVKDIAGKVLNTGA
ncbi:hypothetical protein [Vampirovibrio chlorellavorus]|uniref:hypothetical protein n=1 Tax=Vampirovibrio chlorellavorus TaxID=758823 RepID=UPI0026F35E4F|nr:hypothetical protein [Vampirovibrio chlorellavorus]